MAIFFKKKKKTIDCMKFHVYKGIIPYSEDGVAVMGHAIADTIDSPTNLLKIEAMRGDPIGMYLYGWVLDSKKRYKEATTWYKKAADKGVFPAMYQLALCYIQGDGVPRDGQQAVKLLKEAAEKGNHPSSLVKLGMLYDLGSNVPKSAEQAAYYYERAAEMNHPVGQRNIACNYGMGEGVKMDEKKEEYWRQRAAGNGDPSSQDWCKENGVSYNEPSNVAMTITKLYFSLS